ncbi:OLC1v1000253C2 [Oldenlandia corymbosa var. corymbosa]|nr:OLC1v1000253C2 [Oldenlandia corymbosa var. corymbosa]
MFDIFLEGFWVGEETQSLLNHLLVVSMDQTAYNRCIFRRLNCYRLTTKGVDFGEEKLYMSEDFITMMWARTGFLLNVLKRGYNFIFTDTDVIWLRDPFPILKNFNETNDLLISTDRFKGNPRSTKNRINTGFYYVTSNNKTIALFETWYGRRTNSTGMKEQDVLEGLIAEGTATNKLGLTLRFLDTLYFSGFCRNSNDVRKVITVHANCCKTIGAKVSDLTKVIRDWKMFINQYSRDPVAYNISEFKWSVYDACRKSWKLPPPSS